VFFSEDEKKRRERGGKLPANSKAALDWPKFGKRLFSHDWGDNEEKGRVSTGAKSWQVDRFPSDKGKRTVFGRVPERRFVGRGPPSRGIEFCLRKASGQIREGEVA